MTPNHMKYSSFCCKLPQVIVGLFKAGDVGSFITVTMGNYTVI